VLGGVQVVPPRPWRACGASTWTPPAPRRLHGSYQKRDQRQVQPTRCVHAFRGTPGLRPWEL